MLIKLYEKSKIGFAVLWIIAYCVLMSVGDYLSSLIGIEKAITLPVAILLSSVLLIFLKKHGLLKYYGFMKSRLPSSVMLYYLPVLIMLSTNLWSGVAMNYGALDSILYVLTMLCVGFLEEVIFRGLLFCAMREGSVKAAVITSSVTFGIGHIINLVNGSGAELIPNLLQVVYATAAGFMFVMIFYKTQSLICCIAAHGIFNALSAFSSSSGMSMQRSIAISVILTVITASYALYIALAVKIKDEPELCPAKSEREIDKK